eukprot:TRINITY_DN25388_c0_g1_i1.p1 TRINITY_DN25388_c0_g1~~TRINITY_DN25388_c0_g1_i1.p1  ORF type:complete len:1343 (+),score=358.20 TRINITY_DN25388_c0_g1_i1:156-4184(+)
MADNPFSSSGDSLFADNPFGGRGFGKPKVSEESNPFGGVNPFSDVNPFENVELAEDEAEPEAEPEEEEQEAEIERSVTPVYFTPPPVVMTPPPEPSGADGGPEYPATPRDSERLDSERVHIPYEPSDDVIVTTDSVANLEVIVGKCTTMCPLVDSELNRTRNIYFETTSKSPSDIDFDRVVKSYARSDAGRMVEPSLIRTPKCLYDTTLFLLKDILKREDEHKTWRDNEGRSSRTIHFIDIFAFMRDRLRCVRNDYIIQNHMSLWTVRCLEYTVRFHIMGGHLLCGYPANHGFDPKGNRDMLDDALIDRLWSCYAAFREKYKDLSTDRPVPGVPALKYIGEFAAYRLLYKELRQHDDHKKWRESTCVEFPWENQGNGNRSTDVELKALATMPEVLEHPLVHHAMKILGCYACDNWSGFFKAVSTAPYLQACLMANVFPFVRTMYLSQLWRGTAKNETLKSDDLCRKMLFDNNSQLRRFVEAAEFKVIDTPEGFELESRLKSKKQTLPQYGDGLDLQALRAPSLKVEERRKHRSHLAVCLGVGESWPDDPTAPPVVVKTFVAPEISIPSGPVPEEVVEEPAMPEMVEEEEPKEVAVAVPETIEREESARVSVPADSPLSIAVTADQASPMKPRKPDFAFPGSPAKPQQPPVLPPTPSPMKPPSEHAPTPVSVSTVKPESEFGTPESAFQPMPPPTLPPLPKPQPVGLSGVVMLQLNTDESLARTGISGDEARLLNTILSECRKEAARIKRIRDFHAADGMKKLLSFSKEQFRREAGTRGLRKEWEVEEPAAMDLLPQCLMNIRQHRDKSPVLAGIHALNANTSSSEYRVLMCADTTRVSQKLVADEVWYFIGGIPDSVHVSKVYKNNRGQRVSYRAWREESVEPQSPQCFAHTVVVPLCCDDPFAAAEWAANEVGVIVATQSTQGVLTLSGVLLYYFAETAPVPSEVLATACTSAFIDAGLGHIPVCAVNVSSGYTTNALLRSWGSVSRPVPEHGQTVPLRAFLSDAAYAVTTMNGGVRGWVLTEHYEGEGVVRHVKKISRIVIGILAEVLEDCGVCEAVDNTAAAAASWRDGDEYATPCGRHASLVTSGILSEDDEGTLPPPPLPCVRDDMTQLLSTVRTVFAGGIAASLERTLFVVANKGWHTIHDVLAVLVSTVLNGAPCGGVMMACPMFALPTIKKHILSSIEAGLTPVVKQAAVHPDFNILMDIQKGKLMEVVVREPAEKSEKVVKEERAPLFKTLSGAVAFPVCGNELVEPVAPKPARSVLPSGVLKRLRELSTGSPPPQSDSTWEPSDEDIDDIISHAGRHQPVSPCTAPFIANENFDEYQADVLQYMSRKRARVD